MREIKFRAFLPEGEWINYCDEKIRLVKNNKEVHVIDGINSVLESHFEFMNNSVDIPFVIRETQRKYQHTIAQLSSWKRIK